MPNCATAFETLRCRHHSQPYLDYWCERASTSAVAATRPRSGSLVHAATEVVAPLMWVVPNEQCKEKKPRKWQYQAAVMHAAANATRMASESAGVPILDWSRMVSGQAPMHGLASDTCRQTLDGVHVHHWVDHLRASILLSYLCGVDGQFHPPRINLQHIHEQCAARPPVPPFRRRACGVRTDTAKLRAKPCKD